MANTIDKDSKQTVVELVGDTEDKMLANDSSLHKDDLSSGESEDSEDEVLDTDDWSHEDTDDDDDSQERRDMGDFVVEDDWGKEDSDGDFTEREWEDSDSTAMEEEGSDYEPYCVNWSGCISDDCQENDIGSDDEDW